MSEASPAPGPGRRQGPIELVTATANEHKVVEIAAILGDAVRLLPRPAHVGEVEETGDTLLDNARLKARALAEATGRPAIADDSGLEVDALGGAPGVWSARYAGENATYADNVAKLLEELAALPDAGGERRAAFRTVALVAYPDGREVWAEGTVAGHIGPHARGGGGFGYDPIFVPDEGDGRTFAELAPEEKHAVSARGRAFRALAAKLTADDEDAAGPLISRSVVVVERGPVRNFAEAVLDPSPVYRRPDAALAAGFDAIPAPPTFPVAMEAWGRFEELQPEEQPEANPVADVLGPLLAAGGLILHGEQELEYHRPVVVGDVLEGEARLADVYRRQSKGHTMTFLVTETRWRHRDTGEPVVTARANIIHRS